MLQLFEAPAVLCAPAAGAISAAAVISAAARLVAIEILVLIWGGFLSPGFYLAKRCGILANPDPGESELTTGGSLEV